MHLREELRYKAPSENKVIEIIELANEITIAIDLDHDVSEKILLLSKLLGHGLYDLDYFSTLHCHSSVEEFAEDAAGTYASHVVDITKQELVEILRLARDSDRKASIYYRNLFDANVPLVNASALLYRPQNYKYGDDISEYKPLIEDLVEIAMSKSNIIYL
jgi:hypothetical protein